MTRRQRPPWEVVVIGACMTAFAIVLATCLSIFTIASLLFGLAYMQEHWP